MSIVPVSSEPIITEEMSSVVTAFIDRQLSVDPQNEEITVKEEGKIKNNIDTDSDTDSKPQVNNHNQLSVSQESEDKQNNKTNELKITSDNENIKDDSTRILDAHIDNCKHSTDSTKREINPLINEPTNSKFEESAIELSNEVHDEQKSLVEENTCNSTNNLNEACDVEESGQLRCDEDEYFSCPFRPMSPQSQLRDLCKRGDADQLDKFLDEMCDSEDNGNCVINKSDSQNEMKCAKFIDKSKIDLDAATEDGWTALHDIITHECQFTDVARVLLRYGANVNTQDIHGDSPLHSSLLYHNTDNIELLLKYSANVEATNASGRKPIHIANDAESLDLLLKYGASVNSQDRIGNTPLHYAVVAKDCDRVNLLLAKGCDVDIANNTGACPLHISSDIEIANKLLNAAANPNAIDQNGNIALHVAVKGRHKEWAKLLIYWKGDPHVSNKNGKTPFNLAKDKEMKNILLGKTSELIGGTNAGDTITTIKKLPKARNISANATGVITDGHLPLPYPPTAVISSPSILKRRLDSSNIHSNEKPKGPRLRFSDVNDYSGVEELLPTKRVKVRPIYLEPQFSSDED